MHGLPTWGAHIQLRLSQLGYWGPPIHNMGPCSRSGQDTNAWKQFGPEPDRATEPRYRQRGKSRGGLAGVLLDFGRFLTLNLVSDSCQSTIGNDLANSSRTISVEQGILFEKSRVELFEPLAF